MLHTLAYHSGTATKIKGLRYASIVNFADHHHGHCFKLFSLYTLGLSASYREYKVCLFETTLNSSRTSPLSLVEELVSRCTMPVHIPPEIVALIIIDATQPVHRASLSPSDKATLFSCSLVCTAWTAIAQARLFERP